MGEMQAFVRRVKRILVKKSMKESIQIFLLKPFRQVQNLLTKKRTERALQNEVDEIFDSAHNTDTGGHIPLYNFKIDSKNWIYGNDYEAIDNVEFEKIFKDLNITFEQFFFIDFGSGKGRALLLASRLRFKKIIGVEFCEELYSISKENICFGPLDDFIRNDVVVTCMDVTEYCFPDVPLVLFMFNPFEPPVMKKVIENLMDSYYRHPRRVVVVYCNPVYSYLWDNVTFLERVEAEAKYHIYDVNADTKTRRSISAGYPKR